MFAQLMANCRGLGIACDAAAVSFKHGCVKELREEAALRLQSWWCCQRSRDPILDGLPYLQHATTCNLPLVRSSNSTIAEACCDELKLPSVQPGYEADSKSHPASCLVERNNVVSSPTERNGQQCALTLGAIHDMLHRCHDVIRGRSDRRHAYRRPSVSHDCFRWRSYTRCISYASC